jgi:hypothetical protein
LYNFAHGKISFLNICKSICTLVTCQFLLLSLFAPHGRIIFMLHLSATRLAVVPAARLPFDDARQQVAHSLVNFFGQRHWLIPIADGNA